MSFVIGFSDGSEEIIEAQRLVMAPTGYTIFYKVEEVELEIPASKLDSLARFLGIAPNYRRTKKVRNETWVTSIATHLINQISRSSEIAP